MLLLASLAWSTSESSEVTSIVRYHKGALYSVGTLTYTLDEIRTVASYHELVECPSTDNFLDSVSTIKSYRCDGGAGGNLAKEQSKIYEVVKDWGGWSEQQKKELKPNGFFECEYARDGRDYGCFTIDVMHCIHINPRETISGMKIVAKEDSSYRMVWNGKSYRPPSTITLYKGVDVRIEPLNNGEWPNHLIIKDNKAYVDEALRASVYASAFCPLYKPVNSTWRINPVSISAKYYPSSGWIIKANWDGQPMGRTVSVSSQDGNKFKFDNEIDDVSIQVTAPTAAVMIDTNNVGKDCEIVSCTAVANAGSTAMIDMISGHHGRFLKVLARSPTATHCSIKDETGAEHVIPSQKQFLITTMAHTLSTTKGSFECPKPTEDEYDLMYGFETHRAFMDTPSQVNFLDAITGIKLPAINTKMLLYAAAAAIIVITNFSQIGVIVAATIFLVASIQPAAAFELCNEDIIDNILDTTLVAHHTTDIKFISVILISLTALSISKKNDHDSVKRIVNTGWVFMMKGAIPTVPAILLSVAVLTLSRTKSITDTWHRIVINANNEMNRYANAVAPIIQPVKIKAHSMFGHVEMYTEEEPSSKPYRYIASTPHPLGSGKTEIEMVGKRTVISAPYTRLPGEKKMMKRRREGIKTMRGTILYEDEYDKIRHLLIQMDPTSISRVYAGAIRIHGRELGDLRTFYDRVRSVSLLNQMRAIIDTEYG